MKEEHQIQLFAWFITQQELRQWGGPQMRFPATFKTFYEDAQLELHNNVCLLDSKQKLIAFGQYRMRAGCCHLARLAIASAYRGKGLLEQLLRELVERASDHNKFEYVSLFVYRNNQRAINAYTRLGFTETKDTDVSSNIPDRESMIFMRTSSNSLMRKCR